MPNSISSERFFPTCGLNLNCSLVLMRSSVRVLPALTQNRLHVALGKRGNKGCMSASLWIFIHIYPSAASWTVACHVGLDFVPTLSGKVFDIRNRNHLSSSILVL